MREVVSNNDAVADVTSLMPKWTVLQSGEGGTRDEAYGNALLNCITALAQNNYAYKGHTNCYCKKENDSYRARVLAWGTPELHNSIETGAEEDVAEVRTAAGTVSVGQAGNVERPRIGFHGGTIGGEETHPVPLGYIKPDETVTSEGAESKGRLSPEDITPSRE